MEIETNHEKGDGSSVIEPQQRDEFYNKTRKLTAFFLRMYYLRWRRRAAKYERYNDTFT